MEMALEHCQQMIISTLNGIQLTGRYQLKSKNNAAFELDLHCPIPIRD